ncbi:Putative 3-methyladenine DNA glycosylase [Frondihabitans sp. 762G35]|uniref:DNA-3-methyladenine glycosylase n=1 Tax=Frondihabitans sp. 762G35 TaxID=1446794 RepID=UPI000D225C81|nr:DNA-3-methyladenine glycosylase [Frondihabitans sp. 762G35]ARC56594.1 Putative 3-methyladenine DNA glycosylase [Frondihabitans sp. 762G35]
MTDVSFPTGTALEVAPRLLGAVFRVGEVAVRLTEVEAYGGEGQDPGSHAYRGRTARNASLFAAPGTLYVYLSYGIHRCVNVACGEEGEASGVLLRAGEIVAGIDLARARRPTANSDAELARGPGRLGTALGIELSDDGAASDTPPFSLVLPTGPVGPIVEGPRVGVAGVAGTIAFPYRFALEADPTVSAYRPAVTRRRR